MSSGPKANKKKKVSWASALISLITDCGTMISFPMMACILKLQA